MVAYSREIPGKGLRNRWARPSGDKLAARKSFEPDPVHTGVGIGFLAPPKTPIPPKKKKDGEVS
jgi:hypothetical protein